MNHCWTEEEREIIRRGYAHTHASRREIAKRLGVTEFGVAGQIASMGIAKRTDRRPWTAKEDERLTELMEHYCPRRIARMMKRSLNSVVVRSKRLGVHRRNHNGWFTKREVCEILGVDHHWVQKRLDLGLLKATYHHEHKPQQNGSGAWHIEQKDLREFIRRFPQDLNGRNIDVIMIVEILAGVSNGNHAGKKQAGGLEYE